MKKTVRITVNYYIFQKNNNKALQIQIYMLYYILVMLQGKGHS